MSGQANFPTSLDDDVSLYDVVDGVTSVVAAHHNNVKEAIKALEIRVGILASGSPTSLDYRLGNPTGGHKHDGASGQGQVILPSTPVLAYVNLAGSIPSGNNTGGMPLTIGRTLLIESYSAIVRLPPSGATTAFDANIGGTGVMAASAGLKPMFGPGATTYYQPSPMLLTYPSGAPITINTTAVGNQAPGQDLSVIFVFRENP